MASWKKVIVSGSAAELSTLTLDTALPVAQGGIGASSLTDKAVLISQDSGTDAICSLALTGNGEIIVGGSSGPAVEAAADVAGTGLDASVGDGTLAINVAAAQTSITSLINSSLTKIGTAADQEYIKFDTSNEVNVHINNTERFSVTATGADLTGNLSVSGDVDLTGSISNAGTGYSDHTSTSVTLLNVPTQTFVVTTVTNPGTPPPDNVYAIDGNPQPTLTLTQGNTYRFDQADSTNSGHPLLFYYDAAKTTAFSTGVTTNGTPGSAGAYTQIVVADTTPHILYYQCSSHGYMGNRIGVNSQVLQGVSFVDTTGTAQRFASPAFALAQAVALG